MPLTLRKVTSVPSTMLKKNKKEKLIICFENRRFLKSYCNELLLTDLASKFELTFLIHKHLTGFETEHMEKFGKIVIFQENKIFKKVTSLILSRETFLNRNLSITFATKIKITYPELNQKNIYQNKNMFKKIQRKFSIAFIQMLPNSATIKTLEKFILARFTNIYFLMKSDANQQKILILSGGAYSGFESSVILNSQKLGIENFLLIDNWDNLSSKSIILSEPNVAIVWGDEMEKEAINIHKFASTEIKKLTPLRFNFSGIYTNEVIDKKYVVFSGSGGKDIGEFDMLEKCAYQMKELLKNTKLIYRPHPAHISNYSEFKQNFSRRFSAFENVELESSISNLSAQEWYSLEDLRRVSFLLENCEFLVTPHSTMLIEAHFNGKPAVALSASMLENSEVSRHWNEYQHLVDYKTNPLLILVEDANDLRNAFKRAIELQSNPQIIKDSCKHYISDNSSDFAQGLINIISGSK